MSNRTETVKDFIWNALKTVGKYALVLTGSSLIFSLTGIGDLSTGALAGLAIGTATVDTIINLFERDRSTIYNYNLKASNNHDKPDNYGFVIGEGYNTPKEVIMPDGQSINLYSMAALNWQATQEILERLKYIEDKMEKKEI
jgi:hypothetical protein